VDCFCVDCTWARVTEAVGVMQRELATGQGVQEDGHGGLGGCGWESGEAVHRT
jgi:hypothetical protein